MISRRKLTILAVLLGLVGALLATAGVASGDVNKSLTEERGVLRLHLGDQDYFSFWAVDETDGFALEGEKQYINLGNKCAPVSLSGPNWADFPTNLPEFPGEVGLVDDGLGVRITGPQGTRCGQFDDGEVLVLALGEALEGFSVDYAEIDFEIKFDASINIDFYEDGTHVGSQQVSCDPDESDCGPDSTDGDNYRVRVEDSDGDVFDELRFSLIPSGPNAAASLEGGADGTAACATVSCDPNAPALDDEGAEIPSVGELLETTDSLFHIVQQFDGDLDCLGNPATAGDDINSPKGTFWRQDNSDDSQCILKPYTLTTGSQEIDFEPVGQPNAVYLGLLEYLPEPDPTGPVGIQLYYDDGGPLGSHLMPWCKVDPRDPVVPTKLLLTTAGDPFYDPTDILPSDDETWCLIEADFVSAGTTTSGVPLVDPTYDAYGTGDPSFRFG